MRIKASFFLLLVRVAHSWSPATSLLAHRSSSSSLLTTLRSVTPAAAADSEKNDNIVVVGGEMPDTTSSPSTANALVVAADGVLQQQQQKIMTKSRIDDADMTPLAFGAVPDGIHHLVPASGEEIQQQQQLPLIQLALAGSVTTFFADMIMHPMDCIKTVQQATNGGMSVVAATSYLWDVAGIAGFYHGFLTYACADAISGAVKFVVWEFWKHKTEQDVKDKPQPLPVLALFLGAALAFVASSVTLVPGELLKQQLQVANYESLNAAVVSIYQQSGLPGFYTGYEGVLYRDVPYTMLELGLYELFKMVTIRNQEVIVAPSQTNVTHSSEVELPTERITTATSPWEETVAAAVTGACTAILTTPLDTIKTKLMVDERFVDSSFFDCMLMTVHDNGPLSVFAGVFARIAWIVPFTAIYLPTYDALKRLLLKQHIKQQKLLVPPPSTLQDR